MSKHYFNKYYGLPLSWYRFMKEFWESEEAHRMICNYQDMCHQWGAGRIFPAQKDIFKFLQYSSPHEALCVLIGGRPTYSKREKGVAYCTSPDRFVPIIEGEVASNIEDLEDQLLLKYRNLKKLIDERAVWKQTLHHEPTNRYAEDKYFQLNLSIEREKRFVRTDKIKENTAFSLENWCIQGVIPINPDLTIGPADVGHFSIWEPFVNAFLETLSYYERHMTYICWEPLWRDLETRICAEDNETIFQNVDGSLIKANRYISHLFGANHLIDWTL